MMTDRKDLNDGKEMTFLDHLEVLRWHIVRSFIAIFVLAIVAFVFHDFIFDRIIFAPKEPDFWTNRVLCQFGEWIGSEKLCINSKPLGIFNINFTGQFSTHIIISLVFGLIFAFPYIFWEFWRFVSPALYDNERNNSRGAIFYTSLLMTLGVLFGYYLIVPLSVHFLGSYQVSEQVTNEINLSSYISTLTSIVLASGVIFELPMLIYFLAKTGLVSSAFLKKYRKHSIILILALSAIITPPDVFSQVLVSVPLFLLYEVGIVIARRIERKAAT
jgi:sec-independent protein translocase protein TatC